MGDFKGVRSLDLACALRDAAQELEDLGDPSRNGAIVAMSYAAAVLFKVDVTMQCDSLPCRGWFRAGDNIEKIDQCGESHGIDSDWQAAHHALDYLLTADYEGTMKALADRVARDEECEAARQAIGNL